MCPGSTRKHSIRLATITATTTMGTVRIIAPMVSVISNRGRNAAIVVIDAQNTGAAMRRAAVSAAVQASRPRRCKASECSPTTIASSTTIPTTIMMANMLSMFMD